MLPGCRAEWAGSTGPGLSFLVVGVAWCWSAGGKGVQRGDRRGERGSLWASITLSCSLSCDVALADCRHAARSRVPSRRGSAFFTVPLKGAGQGGKDVTRVIAGPWPPAPRCVWHRGRLVATCRATMIGTFRPCSPCHTCTVVVTSSRPKPHERLYRSRSAAMTVVPWRQLSRSSAIRADRASGGPASAWWSAGQRGALADLPAEWSHSFNVMGVDCPESAGQLDLPGQPEASAVGYV